MQGVKQFSSTSLKEKKARALRQVCSTIYLLLYQPESPNYTAKKS